MTPAKPAVRLEPADEYLHENTGESNFNESMYFNFFDTSQRLGGFLRIGNRPNERMAETTLCLYQPDGRVVFNFKRPPIADNSRFQAGGMRFQVDQPFERLRIVVRAAWIVGQAVGRRFGHGGAGEAGNRR